MQISSKGSHDTPRNVSSHVGKRERSRRGTNGSQTNRCQAGKLTQGNEAKGLGRTGFKNRRVRNTLGRRERISAAQGGTKRLSWDLCQKNILVVPENAADDLKSGMDRGEQQISEPKGQEFFQKLQERGGGPDENTLRLGG